MMDVWGNGAPLTVMDREGKRYSLDVFADSSYDAAHSLTHGDDRKVCNHRLGVQEVAEKVRRPLRYRRDSNGNSFISGSNSSRVR